MNKIIATICLAIFGLPFAMVGAFVVPTYHPENFEWWLIGGIVSVCFSFGLAFGVLCPPIRREGEINKE